MSAEPEIVTDDTDMFDQVGKPAGQVASVATAYEDRQIMTGRIWIWFSENGNIRKWSAEPFEEGTEYVVATALSDQAARIAELETELYLLRNDRANKADQIYHLETSLTASRAECEGLRAALKMPDAGRRLWYISDLLARAGHFNRRDICEAFKVSAPQASIDIKRWLEAHPLAAEYNKSSKRYKIASAALSRKETGDGT